MTESVDDNVPPPPSPVCYIIDMSRNYLYDIISPDK